METINSALQRSKQIESDSARLDAELLLCHVLKCERSYLRTWPDKLLEENQLTDFLELISRRQAGEPVAHLIGKQAFWTLDLLVSPETLIPRPDTELLVEQALALSLPDHASIIDLGTGTGAIALALASERPNWTVTGIDCADEVIALANENAAHNNLQSVRFLKSDWFESIPSQQFDLIVSNPPYIEEDDPHLKQGDVRYEPIRALVASEQGLADIEHIAKASLSYLKDEGWLILEHGYDQGERVRACFSSLGYQSVQTRQDLGQNDRITFGQKAPT